MNDVLLHNRSYVSRIVLGQTAIKKPSSLRAHIINQQQQVPMR